MSNVNYIRLMDILQKLYRYPVVIWPMVKELILFYEKEEFLLVIDYALLVQSDCFNQTLKNN